jgi:hypothetical protein
LRLGPTVYDLSSFCLKNFSVTSVTVQGAFLLGGGIPPVGSGRACLDTLDAPEGRSVSHGATYLVVPSARLCVLPTREDTGPD